MVATPGKLLVTPKEGANIKEILESSCGGRPEVTNCEVLDGVGIGVVHCTDMESMIPILKSTAGIETVEKDVEVSVAAEPKPIESGKLLLTFKDGADQKAIMKRIKHLKVTGTEHLEAAEVAAVDVSDLSAFEALFKTLDGVASVERDMVVSIAGTSAPMATRKRPASAVPMPTEEAVKKAKAEMAKSLEEFPLAGGGCPPPPELAQAIGPAWTRGEIEKPADRRDMGGWIKAVYSAEQQQRLGVDEEGNARPQPAGGKPGKLILTFTEGASKEQTMILIKALPMVKAAELLSIGLANVDVTDVSSGESALKAVPGVATVEPDSVVGIA